MHSVTMSLTLVAVETTLYSMIETLLFVLLSTSESGQIDITPQSRFTETGATNKVYVISN